MPSRHFNSFTPAHPNLRSVLDAAHDGLVTTVVRGNERLVVVTGADLRADLALLSPANAVISSDGGGWSAILRASPSQARAAPSTPSAST